MIHSILYNLVGNSIKYRSTDQTPVIEISTEEDRDQFFIVIKDNGLGMDRHTLKEHISKLYRRFHPHIEGRGLGLYLVKFQREALGEAFM